MFWFCEDICLAINIAEINAALTGKMTRALIPGIILSSFNFQMMGFCTAQKIDRVFGISNLLAIVICVGISEWLALDLQVGIYMFPICIMIKESINFCAI